MTAVSGSHRPVIVGSAPNSVASSDTARTAIVAGGGISGIAAALRLADAGVRVTLLETRPRLGGRATSFVDPRTGETLDNCQHVVMGCCTAYLDLLRRLGVEHEIEWTREQYWIERDGPGTVAGRESIVKPGVLPAPFHFTGAVLGASFLTAGQKAALAWGAHMVAHAKRAEWTNATFADFLRAARQPAGLVAKFWAPIVVSACNLSCERVCAASALMVFQDGFFANPRAAQIGVSRVPLLRLYDQAEQSMVVAGGSVRRGFSVDRLGTSWVEGTERGRTERLEADAVVCALPIERALGVIESAILQADARFAPMLAAHSAGDDDDHRVSRWSFSPILGVHLAFDRPVLRRPHAVLVPRADDATVGVGEEAGRLATQWLFRKDTEGKRVHAVISAADAWMGVDEQAIVARVLADLHAHLPTSRGATVQWARAVKEKRATFAGTPDVERLRPAVMGNSGLVLAGDYTATGWPATMEGAARSGYAAAAAVLGQHWEPANLRPSGLARWLVQHT